MFRRWPFFQRLLSWTKPYAPEARTARDYQRYDWNSLIADEPELRSLQAEFMDGSSYFPSRPEMEPSLAAFAERAGDRGPLRLPLGADARARRAPTARCSCSRRPTANTAADASCWPWASRSRGAQSPPGIEHARHYAETREAASYAGKRLFIIGKQNSGFELASGLAAWASKIIVSSPSPAKTSVQTRSLVGVRARYVQPFEDNFLGLGVSILDAAIDAIVHAGGALPGGPQADRQREGRSASRSTRSSPRPGSPVRCGTCRPWASRPSGGAKLPAVTPIWESGDRARHLLRRHHQPGRGRPKKHGIPANSGAVHGHRYNALILARHIAETHFGVDDRAPARRPGRPRGLPVAARPPAPRSCGTRRRTSPGSSRSPTAASATRASCRSSTPWTAMTQDVITMTVEADGTGALYPVAYCRRNGRLEEHALPGHPLLDFTTPRAPNALHEAVGGLRAAAALRVG